MKRRDRTAGGLARRGRFRPARDRRILARAVRAYLEPQGDKPAALEMLDEDDDEAEADPPPLVQKSAKEMKGMIAKAHDPEWLRDVLTTDPRSTVMAAADHRLAELQAGASDPPDPHVDPPADPE